MSLHELINKLRNEEETILIDLLGLRSDEIVDSFLDLITENYEYLASQYQED